MIETGCLDVGHMHKRSFDEQGFVCIGRLTTDEETVWLRTVYDEIVKHQMGYTPEALATGLGWRKPRYLIKITSLESIVPELKHTLLLRNARKAAAYLLGVAEAQLLSGWRIFCKPAQGGETPWHQDAAYRPPPHHGASVWIPLEPATLDNGCMHYVGGSHLEALRPHHLHDDKLVADDVDTSRAIACPLLPGEATVHHFRTLHGARPNKTDAPRRALVIVCQSTQG